MIKLKRDRRGARYRRKVKHNPFNNSEQAQYWLGYIAADGCVSTKANTISIISKDVEHLSKYAVWLGLNMHCSGNKVCTANFSNEFTKKELVWMGITPRKSLTLKYLANINWHFVRGYFDGDGSCRVRKGSSEIKFTGGSKIFLLQLKAFFSKHGIECYLGVQQRAKNITYYLAVYTKYHQRFITKLYGNATIFLERKFYKMQLIAERRFEKFGELSGTLT